MRERPILFSGPEVCAILEGRKTVTRRIIKPGFPAVVTEVLPYVDAPGAWMPPSPRNSEEPWDEQVRVCPWGWPGERLWVRETWTDVNLLGAPGLAYKADGGARDLMEDESFLDEGGAFNYDDPRAKPYHFSCWYADLEEAKWRPSIHMPRWASRILLEVTAVRVQRLHSISPDQVLAEGFVQRQFELGYGFGLPNWSRGVPPREAFRALWVHINGANSWEANPWVWAVEFKRLEATA